MNMNPQTPRKRKRSYASAAAAPMALSMSMGSDSMTLPPVAAATGSFSFGPGPGPGSGWTLPRAATAPTAMSSSSSSAFRFDFESNAPTTRHAAHQHAPTRAHANGSGSGTGPTTPTRSHSFHSYSHAHSHHPNLNPSQPSTPNSHNNNQQQHNASAHTDLEGDTIMNMDDDPVDLGGPSPTPRKRRLTTKQHIARLGIGYPPTTPGGSMPMDLDSPARPVVPGSLGRAGPPTTPGRPSSFFAAAASGAPLRFWGTNTPTRPTSFSSPLRPPTFPTASTQFGWALPDSSASSAGDAMVLGTPLRKPLPSATLPVKCAPSPFYKSDVYKASPDRIIIVEDGSVTPPSGSPTRALPAGLQTPKRGTPGKKPAFLAQVGEAAGGGRVVGARKLFVDVLSGAAGPTTTDQAQHHKRAPIPSSPLATARPLSTHSSPTSLSSTAPCIETTAAALRVTTAPAAARPIPSAARVRSTPTKPRAPPRTGGVLAGMGGATPLAPVPEHGAAAAAATTTTLSKPSRTLLNFAAMAQGGSATEPARRRVTRSQATLGAEEEAGGVGAAAAAAAPAPVPAPVPAGPASLSLVASGGTGKRTRDENATTVHFVGGQPVRLDEVGGDKERAGQAPYALRSTPQRVRAGRA